MRLSLSLSPSRWSARDKAAAWVRLRLASYELRENIEASIHTKLLYAHKAASHKTAEKIVKQYAEYEQKDAKYARLMQNMQ
jgi:hypothetical protein